MKEKNPLEAALEAADKEEAQLKSQHDEDAITNERRITEHEQRICELHQNAQKAELSCREWQNMCAMHLEKNATLKKDFEEQMESIADVMPSNAPHA